MEKEETGSLETQPASDRTRALGEGITACFRSVLSLIYPLIPTKPVGQVSFHKFEDTVPHPQGNLTLRVVSGGGVVQPGL